MNGGDESARRDGRTVARPWEHGAEAPLTGPALGATTFRPRSRLDPRLYQSTVLAGLLAYGLATLHFETSFPQVVVTLASALATQWVVDASARRAFDPRSALISGLSLCL